MTTPTLNARLVAELVSTQFPTLSPAEASYLGEGCDSVAFVVNRQYVFRFPKRDDVEEQLLREVPLLASLGPRLPIAIPRYEFVGQPSAHFSRQFGGYPLIDGTPAIHLDLTGARLVALAPAIGGALSALHGWDAADATALGVPGTGIDDVIDEVRSDALADFDLLAHHAPGAPLEHWHAYLKARPQHAATPARPVVVHADLAAEHVLCDPRSHAVTGIIDWSEIAMADAALDFAGMYHWGGSAFVEAILLSYTGPPLEPVDRERARYLAACRAVADVRFGLDANRPEYIRGAIQALSLCVG